MRRRFEPMAAASTALAVLLGFAVATAQEPAQRPAAAAQAASSGTIQRFPNPCPIAGLGTQESGKTAATAQGDQGSSSTRIIMGPEVIAALPQEKKKALLDCLLAAEAKGDPSAAFQLGEQYRAKNGIVPQDYKKAFEYNKRAVELGNYRGLGTLGEMYMDGEGVEKNEAEGMKLLIQAVEKGDTKAPREVGRNYESGRGVPVDLVKAEQYYRMAAEKNDITGQCLLGSFYERGIAVKQDYDQAIAWYLKSAARGDIIAAPAMAALGSLYETRSDGKQDVQKAIEWYKKAADQKDHEAMEDLARLTAPNAKPASTPRNLCLTIFEQTCDLPLTGPCKQ